MTMPLSAYRAQKDEAFRKDPQSPLSPVQQMYFSGLIYFDENPALRLEVRVEAFAKQDDVQIQTTSGDTRWYRRFGSFSFDVKEQAQRLTIYQAPHGFFLPFVDAGAGTLTYPAGRYLEPVDLGDGLLLVDFNLAYNPLCAYEQPEALTAKSGQPGKQWNCPITPAENRLSVLIEAGEKMPQGEWVV